MSLENEERNSAYEKLTPQRKQLVDKVMENLEKGNLFWSQGWVSSGAPESAVTGKKYRGINNLFKELDIWKDKTFEEVSIDELREKGKTGKVEQEKSTEYIKPSELVATEVAAKALPVSMEGRGSESLTRMSDRETLARAEGYYAKDSKFADLYVGKNVMKNIERSESGLMLRLAMFCGNDEEQLLRIFKSSGQFRDEKPNAYYMKLASESMKTIREMRGSIAAAQENNGFTKGKIGINSKR